MFINHIELSERSQRRIKSQLHIMQRLASNRLQMRITPFNVLSIGKCVSIVYRRIESRIHTQTRAFHPNKSDHQTPLLQSNSNSKL